MIEITIEGFHGWLHKRGELNVSGDVLQRRYEEYVEYVRSKPSSEVFPNERK